MKKNEWIPVTDDLPPIEEDVLVATIGEGEDHKAKMFVDVARISFITQTKARKRPTWYDAKFEEIEPTHWMKLPEPPPLPA
jgi:hypothetical protein